FSGTTLAQRPSRGPSTWTIKNCGRRTIVSGIHGLVSHPAQVAIENGHKKAQKVQEVFVPSVLVVYRSCFDAVRNLSRRLSSLTFAAMKFTISVARVDDSSAPLVSPSCDLSRARAALTFHVTNGAG